MTCYNLKVLSIFLLIYSIVFNHVHALNILVIVSLPLRSHYMAFQRLFSELAIRGHSVTVMNNYPEENAPKNLSFIDMTTSNTNPSRTMQPMADFENVNPMYSHLKNFYRHLYLGPRSTKEDCENFFTNENVKSLHKKNIKYDVIFVEQFISDCGLAYAAVVYDAPIIGITSHTLLPWAYPRLGIPFDFGADAFYFSRAGPNPSFFYKVESFIMNLVFNTIGRWHIQRSIYEVFDKYLPNRLLDIEKAVKEKMKMMFVNQHYAITGTRLLSPQVLEIAGVHIGQPKAIPQEIGTFLSSAKHGVIYVSFGSNLRANTMSKDKINEFLLAFKKIPQKVLWKLENITLPVGNDNVFIHNWFPQLDVLCHPKVLAFVSHGGMLSLSEAAHCGKPLITIPFFGDQYSNAAAASSIGLGIFMDFVHVDADTLAEAIKRLTSNKMKENAQNISRLWHDRPQDVLDSAIYWTEYVARHRTAPTSLPSSRSSWFQFTLLDVYIVICGIMFTIVLFIYTIIKNIKLIILVIVGFLGKRDNKHKNE